MLSATDIQGNSRPLWNTIARVAPAATVNVPVLTCSSPAMVRNKVVLPQPLGPTNATALRGAIDNVISVNAVTPVG